ncbi:MAG: hypothetical protein H7Z75_17460 [Ferruginibacter sp.]|nr:hypothetical protein [Cytophagales bacterium]
MKNMTDAQKTAYVQQRMNQTYGDHRPGHLPSNAQLDFARQMQDPEFKRAFQKMTPEAQAAYVLKLQPASQPTPASTGKPNVQNDPRMQAATAEITAKMMNDPKFRAEFSKKSEAEREAYFRQVARQHGITDAEMNGQGPSTAAADQKNADRDRLVNTVDKGAEMSSTAVNPFVEGKAPRPTYADSVDFRHRRVGEWQETEIKKLPIVERNEAGSFPDPAKVREIERQATAQHLKLVAADLKYYAADWQQKKRELKQLVAPFNEALAKARFGEGFTEGAEGEFVKALAGYQSTMFQHVASLNNRSQNAHEYAARWYVNKLTLEKEHAASSQRNPSDASAPTRKNGLKSVIDRAKKL